MNGLYEITHLWTRKIELNFGGYLKAIRFNIDKWLDADTLFLYNTSVHQLCNLDYKRTDQIVFGVERLFREDIRGTFEIFYKRYSAVPISASSLTIDRFDAS